MTPSADTKKVKEPETEEMRKLVFRRLTFTLSLLFFCSRLDEGREHAVDAAQNRIQGEDRRLT